MATDLQSGGPEHRGGYKSTVSLLAALEHAHTCMQMQSLLDTCINCARDKFSLVNIGKTYTRHTHTHGERKHELVSKLNAIKIVSLVLCFTGTIGWSLAIQLTEEEAAS